MKKCKIIYYGTPQFAVAPLKAILEAGFDVAAVVTSVDKAAGRGMKIQVSAVKQFALDNNLRVLQPSNLKSDEFQDILKEISPDLQIVVAFRMLPEKVWNFPRLGTFNIHASLLPKYRGAAPINWAIINGEKETGITIFKLKHEIDTGDIAFQAKVSIDEKDNYQTLHDKLMNLGATNLPLTLSNLLEHKIEFLDQDAFINEEIMHAPKLNKENTRIDFNQKATKVQKQIQGLTPWPTAWCLLDSKLNFKVFNSEVSDIKSNNPGLIKIIDAKLFVACLDYYLELIEVQIEGKKRMKSADFLLGNSQIEGLHLM